ncbi:NAD(P)/FAD-dependent oxidoreductase [Chungangia koreensis]|uniref:NAD(P)/FAD-dependent oxidoreductase n=1 Tax=Chungangia koreensis TaxID=752657 RepID=A0ABV8X929_9LACT
MKVVIIGAGIVGASTAYHLSKKGVDVIIVDRMEPGRATDAAAGIICPWLSQRRNKAWYALAKGGAAYYPDLIKQLEADGETETGYKRVGAISLHTDEFKLEKMMERARKRREDAPEIGEIRLLDNEETKSLFPMLSDSFRSVYVEGAARVNGKALREALLKSARKSGTEFINGSAELYKEHDIVRVVVNGKQLDADQIIVTAGAWAGELLTPLVKFKVKGQKAQIIHLQTENLNTGEWPVVMPPNDQYILGFEDGRIIAGATHEDDCEFDLRVTAGGMNEVLQKALGTAPGLEKAEFIEMRVGYRPFTPDFLPVVGHLPAYRNVYVANGLGASGLTVGPYLGRQLSKLVLGEAPDLDLRPYDVKGAID